MLASRIVAPAKVVTTEVQKPRLQEGTVLVKMQVGTLCGSDLDAFEKPLPAQDYPLPPGFSGHECVGVVEDTDTNEFQKGERVLVCPSPPAGFVEYIVIEPQRLVHLPPVEDSGKIVLAQQLGTVIYSCKRMPNVLDMDVAILGQGPAGLFFTAMLRNMGARKIIGIDVIAHRLAIARQMGATHVVDASMEDPVSAVRDITGGDMADLAVEAVGDLETVNQVVDLVRERGYLVLFGIAPDGPLEFNYMHFFRKYLTTLTSAGADLEKDHQSFKLAMDMIVQGRIDVSSLVSHRLSLTEIGRAYELALHKRDGAVKILIDLQS
jgi:threonine dehydrogenase-like Zn-dependent dehydrogenase